MKNLKLVEPSSAYLEQLAAYRKEFEQSGEHMDGGAHLADNWPFEKWFAYIDQMANPNEVPTDRVPSTTLLCLRESDGKMVGICNIRHNLSLPYAFNRVGHIGYSIAPSERHKGYGKEQLCLALLEAAKLDIKNALVTCDETNIGSEKTILANGGAYENTYYDELDDSTMKRFWIEVTHDQPQR